MILSHQSKRQSSEKRKSGEEGSCWCNNNRLSVSVALTELSICALTRSRVSTEDKDGTFRFVLLCLGYSIVFCVSLDAGFATFLQFILTFVLKNILNRFIVLNILFMIKLGARIEINHPLKNLFYLNII